MDRTELKGGFQTLPSFTISSTPSSKCISLETEIPEELYHGIKEFIGANPHLDQYGVMTSALANFLYQNGCSDKAVTEQYLNDLFTLSHPA